MKKHFHIGIRADEIVGIYPSGKDDKKDFPTCYSLRNGETRRTTGDWRENVAQVEAILNSTPCLFYETELVKAWLEKGEKYAPRKVIAAMKRIMEQL